MLVMGFAMSIVAPHVRKPLSADARLRLVRSGFASLPEHPLDDTEMAFTEARLAALAMVARNAPSLLALAKERAESHVHPLSGMARVPCDTSRRAILAPVSPKGLRPVGKRLWRQRQRGKALEAMPLLAGHDLWARDGTAYCSSKPRHWASGVPRGPRHGSLT